MYQNLKHRSCKTSKQCVNKDKVCDNERNCYDKSDEVCKNSNSLLPAYQKGLNQKLKN